MAYVRKRLGAAAPTTAETDLYTVPAGKSAIVSWLSVCNRTVGDLTFRISVSLAGAATVNADFLYYDVTITGNDTLNVTSGMTLAATDVLRVRASAAGLSFSAFGLEATP